MLHTRVVIGLAQVRTGSESAAQGEHNVLSDSKAVVYRYRFAKRKICKKKKITYHLFQIC